MAEREKLIELKDLQITFGSGKKKFVAVDHVNFDIYKGETFSLVGESGSGKTTIGRAICRINPTSGGDIFFKGQKINGKISKELDQEVIRKIQMIFQDPMASLNERAKVEYIVAEGLLNHHLYKDQNDLHEKVMNALHEVGLLPEFASRFPHEFSGGQRQRIGIARALVMEPEFIVADEPISALDVSIRAQVLNLLNSMKKSRGLTYLFIAHDLSVVRFISDRIAVISKGRIVELECHRRNAQLEHHARRGHEQRRFQLCRDGLLFHSPNFAGKTGQITLLRIAGFQVPESLDVLLNAVRTGHFRRHGPGLHLVLHPVAAHHDSGGYRDDP